MPAQTHKHITTDTVVYWKLLTLAPLVDQKWRRFRVSRLDPGREQPPLVRLVPEVLVQVGVSDLLQWLHVVHGHQVAVQVHELNAHLFEGSLGEQVPLDTGQGLVRVVVSLLDQPQLLALTLVQTTLHTVRLLQPLQSQDQQLRVVLVGERGEGDGGEPAALQPVDCGGVYGNGLLRGDVGPVLQVVVLPLLLRLQVESGEAAQVLLADSLVHGGSAADALAVVVGSVGPPVRLALHVAQDHVLHRDGQPGDLGGGGGGGETELTSVAETSHTQEWPAPSRGCWPSSSARPR